MPYTLTVQYQYLDGSEVAESQTYTVLQGDGYTLTLPEIDHYAASVTSDTGTMPARNSVITVLYVPEKELPAEEETDLLDIEDYGTPLGYGGAPAIFGECAE